MPPPNPLVPSQLMRRPWYRDPITLAATTLAAARITRLITADTWPPAVKLRETAYRRIEARAPGWGHGVDCPWCVSPWIAAALVAAHEATARTGRHRALTVALLPLAISTIVGALAEQELH